MKEIVSPITHIIIIKYRDIPDYRSNIILVIDL